MWSLLGGSQSCQSEVFQATLGEGLCQNLRGQARTVAGAVYGRRFFGGRTGRGDSQDLSSQARTQLQQPKGWWPLPSLPDGGCSRVKLDPTAEPIQATRRGAGWDSWLPVPRPEQRFPDFVWFKIWISQRRVQLFNWLISMPVLKANQQLVFPGKGDALSSFLLKNYFCGWLFPSSPEIS